MTKIIVNCQNLIKKQDSTVALINTIHQIVNSHRRLFRKSPNRILINYFLIKTDWRKKFPKLPLSVTGFIPLQSKSTIYLLLPSCSKINHSTTSLLLHEIAHLFINNINPNLPNWLKEGLAVYSARQLYKCYVSKTTFSKFFQNYTTAENKKLSPPISMYLTLGLFTRLLIQQVSWKKFIHIITNYRLSFGSFLFYYCKQTKIDQKKLQNSFEKHYIKKPESKSSPVPR